MGTHVILTPGACWEVPEKPVMTPLPGIPGILANPGNPWACSKSLFGSNTHSFTFTDFCCPLTPLLGILGARGVCSKKLGLEQPSFTFADFCCPLTHLLGIPGARGACSKKLVLEQHSFTSEETTEGGGLRPSVVGAEGRHVCIGSEQSTCPSSQHSTCLASQEGRCLGSQRGTCLTFPH